MNSKYAIIGCLALGLGVILYKNFMPEHIPPTQNPHAVQSTAGIEGAPLALVKVPDLSNLAQQGKLVFDANCAACHGSNAAGKDGVAPPLVHIIYEPNHHGDASFLLAAKNGVRAHHWPFGDMPPVDGITEDSIALIVAYVRELQRANGIN